MEHGGRGALGVLVVRRVVMALKPECETVMNQYLWGVVKTASDTQKRLGNVMPTHVKV